MTCLQDWKSDWLRPVEWLKTFVIAHGKSASGPVNRPDRARSGHAAQNLNLEPLTFTEGREDNEVLNHGWTRINTDFNRSERRKQRKAESSPESMGSKTQNVKRKGKEILNFDFEKAEPVPESRFEDLSILRTFTGASADNARISRWGKRLAPARWTVWLGIATNKVYADFGANLREALVSRQRPATRVDRVNITNLSCGDNAVPIAVVAL